MLALHTALMYSEKAENLTDVTGQGYNTDPLHRNVTIQSKQIETGLDVVLL